MEMLAIKQAPLGPAQALEDSVRTAKPRILVLALPILARTYSVEHQVLLLEHPNQQHLVLVLILLRVAVFLVRQSLRQPTCSELRHRTNQLGTCSVTLGQQALVVLLRDLEQIMQLLAHHCSARVIPPISLPPLASTLHNRLLPALPLDQRPLRVDSVEVSLETLNRKIQQILSVDSNNSNRLQTTRSAPVAALARHSKIQELLYSATRNLRRAFSVHLLLPAAVCSRNLHLIRMPLEVPIHRILEVCSEPRSQLRLVRDFSVRLTTRQILEEATSLEDLVDKHRIRPNHRPTLSLVG